VHIRLESESGYIDPFAGVNRVCRGVDVKDAFNVPSPL